MRSGVDVVVVVARKGRDYLRVESMDGRIYSRVRFHSGELIGIRYTVYAIRSV